MAKTRGKKRNSARKAPSRRVATPRRPVTAASRVADSGLAPGMQPLSAYLPVANVAASASFLEKTFGFARGVTLREPDGQLRYAEMRHGTSVVVLVRKGDETAATGGAAGLYTYVSDVDAAAGRAREAGAGVGEAEDKPWGDRTAVVTDPDGYRWVLATFKKLVPFEAGES